MTPPYRGIKRKAPLPLEHSRDKGANPLRYHSCSGKMDFRHSFRCIGRTRRVLLGFRPLLGGDTRSGHITALHQTAALWNVGADGLVLVIALSIYLVTDGEIGESRWREILF